MPYRWQTPAAGEPGTELHLWPHQSLSARGFSIFILSFFLLALIPFFGLVGTVLLWALLPFMLAAVGGIWVAIRWNARDRQVLEILTLSPERTRLVRHNPRGPDQFWDSDTYWVSVVLHEAGGPVPYYVTLKGAGREVEIGAFLSEDERKALYAELRDQVRQLSRP